MNDKRKEAVNSIIALLVIVMAFLVASYYSQIYIEEIRSFIGEGYTGMFIYVLLNVIEVIIAPVNLLPTIAIASSLWGGFTAGLLTTIGWVVGAFVAFMLARRFGLPLVRKLVSVDKIQKIEDKIPNKHVFWSVVFLRIILPADILSYVLGLFSKISKRDFVLATTLGVAPLAFALAYLGTFPLEYQIIAFVIAGTFIMAGYLTYRKKEVIKDEIKKIKLKRELKRKEKRELKRKDKLNSQY